MKQKLRKFLSTALILLSIAMLFSACDESDLFSSSIDKDTEAEIDKSDNKDSTNVEDESNSNAEANGKDGITPKLKINETTNMWEVSYDNGATWESLGITANGVIKETEPFTFAEKDGGYSLVAYNGTEANVIIPAEYNGKPVIGIEQYAFFRCYSIKSVSVPNSVKKIAHHAFVSCTNLESMSLPFIGGGTGNTDLFLGYIFGAEEHTNQSTELPSALKNITINEGAMSIGNAAFYNCTGLESITIPNSVTSIGDSAFYGCTGLESITIPNSVTSIGNDAFVYCSDLENITVEAGNTTYKSDGNCLIEIATNTLVLGCKNSVIPNYVKSIGNSAFYGCTGLTSITIPSSVESIGSLAFSNCVRLFEVYNLSSLTIEKGSFSYGDIGIYARDIYTYTDSPSKLHTDKNGYIFYVDEKTVILLGYTGTDTELILPDGYNGSNYMIYSYAFSYNTSIKSVSIPDSVTGIGAHAFRGCTSLKNITISDSVEYIRVCAFYGCTSLTSITFEDTDTWYTTTNVSGISSNGTKIDVTDTGMNVTYVTGIYVNYYWYKV